MSSYRSQHNSESIKREITAIIRRLKDPRLSENFISILKISSSKDSSSFNVFISSLNGIDNAKNIANCLQLASGYIRKELGSRLRVRYVPNLKFIATDALEYGMNMSKKIDEILHPHIKIEGSMAEENNCGEYVTLSNIAQNIEDRNFFCILTHNYPDGDAVGSAVALCLALQSLGKFAKVEFGGEVPEKFKFLLSYTKKQDFNPETYISVDLADPNLLHENLKFLSEKIDICIDHHKSNKNYAKMNFVEPFSAANCEVLFELFQEMNCKIDKNIAKCLYIGIATDTGGFMYSNVTPNTHAIVSELLKQNIGLSKINEQIFISESGKKFELKKAIYNNLNFLFGGKVAISHITLAEMDKIGISDSELDGIASIPIKIEDVEIGVIVREKNDGFCKISVRTKSNIDANEFCTVFNGGGHACAGGFNISGDASNAEKLIIEAIKKFTGWCE